MEYNFKDLEELNLNNKTVIIRSNLDVVLTDGVIIDNTQLKYSARTIKFLSDKGAKIVIIGHIGSPNGEYVDNLSLIPIRFELGKIIGKQIKFANIANCKNSIAFLNPGEILMLENIRFSPEETSDDNKTREDFIAPLAKAADYFINDHFGLNEKHASVYDITKLVDSYAGLNLIYELTKLNEISTSNKPLISIIGGELSTDRLNMIKYLASISNKLLLAEDIAVGFIAHSKNIKLEDDIVNIIQSIKDTAKTNNCDIVLPLDFIIDDLTEISTKNLNEELLKKIRDIGPNTVSEFINILTEAKTILWSGPMGNIEDINFEKGTLKIADFIAHDLDKSVFKIVGGDRVINALIKFGINFKKFSHVSLGGNMMLKYLGGQEFEIFKFLKSN